LGFSNTKLLFAQNLFHQDIFYGGVAAGGFSTGQGAGSGTMNLFIEPGSTIRKAYLFSYRIGYPPTVPITVNSVPYIFDTLNCIMSVSHTNPNAVPIKLYYYDITNDLNSIITSTFNITIPDQFGLPINWSWCTAFIYIEYDNPALTKVTSTIWVNDKDYVGNETYLMSAMNPVNTSNPVGFSLFIDRACNSITEGTIVNVNSSLIGQIGTPDAINSLFSCGGSKGHFYYQNNNLIGLDDDTPDNIMNGSDALADMSSYLINGATGYSLNLVHTNPNPAPNQPHFNLLFLNAYTTPCDTFTTSIISDTIICNGDSIQLFANGGSSYSWLPQTGLSNSNSSTPIASPDSTTLYIVKIENTPGCSRTEKVLVKVNELPNINNITIEESVCGNNNGQISIVATGENPLQYSIGIGFQNNNSFTNLSTGNYPITVLDNNGCSFDTTVFIPETNLVNANFTATPQMGAEPLFVELTNLSANATNYSWSINTDFLSNNLNETYIFNNSGSYIVELIAWNNLPQCSDTFSLQIIVYDSLMLQIPNVFTPNNDGINDVFSITIDGAKKVNAYILNRWGNTIQEYSNSIFTIPSTLVIWNGEFKGVSVTEGVYFYKIEITDMQDKIYYYQGYVHIEK
jgi:gliding motility-associated-like protein